MISTGSSGMFHCSGQVFSRKVNDVRRGKPRLQKEGFHTVIFRQSIPCNGGMCGVVSGKLLTAQKMGDNEHPPGSEHAAHLAHRAFRISEMGKCGKADDPVKTVTLERNGMDVRSCQNIPGSPGFCVSLSNHSE